MTTKGYRLRYEIVDRKRRRKEAEPHLLLIWLSTGELAFDRLFEILELYGMRGVARDGEYGP